MAVHPMVNPVRPYAWGSRTALAEIAGRPPAESPEAELWMGAHPGAPSLVEDRPLDELMAEDPKGFLGTEVVDRFGPRLPFLLKILGVETSLSLQVHPSAAQAAEGFAREEAGGVSPDASSRTYRDPFGKPELVVAVTAFDALCGFRPVAEARALVAGLGVPRLAPLVDDLAVQPHVRALRSAFTRMVTWPDQDRAALVDEVVAAAHRRGGAVAYAWLVRLAKEHPGDPTVLSTLLLNAIRLGPGEGLLLGPGMPHAYLHGTAVEIMGASDNVLRAGLTPKHVDVEGLLRTVTINTAPVSILRPRPNGVEQVWRVKVPEFRLSRVRVEGGAAPLPGGFPQVVACLRGRLVVEADEACVDLPAGSSAFVEARATGVRLSGSGEVYRATVGDAAELPDR